MISPHYVFVILNRLSVASQKLNGRFGSLAAPQHPISLSSAIGSKADIRTHHCLTVSVLSTTNNHNEVCLLRLDRPLWIAYAKAALTTRTGLTNQPEGECHA